MTDINLLPWRELKREQEKKWFTTLLAIGLCAGALVVFLFNVYAKSLIDNQKSRNQRLEHEITLFDKKIGEITTLKKVKEALISRMLIVQNLQSTRILTVHLFDELIQILPEGIHVRQVERKNNFVNVLGIADSNSNISQLMRNIEKNEWIQLPILTEIKTSSEKNKNRDNEFRLSFLLKTNEPKDKKI